MVLDRDNKKAKALFQGSCTEQIGVGCHALALTISEDQEICSSADENCEKALEILKMGARSKDANSSARLSFSLRNILERNGPESESADAQKKRIQELLQESCTSTPQPEVFMGGAGFEIQVGRWEFFAEQAKACFSLGENTKEAEEAKNLIATSCRMEYAVACQQLCDNGVGESCFDLGSLYRHGSGVAKSPENKIKYFQKGCDLGYKVGCLVLEYGH
jgi:TPR repeat protein